MNLKVEHGIIALLLIAFLYYFFTHQSLLSDLSRVPDKGGLVEGIEVMQEICDECKHVPHGVMKSPMCVLC